MLNQQEFRIGNIIRFNEYFEDDPMLPNEGPLDKDDFIELIEGHLSKAEPIELTEEWLKKFGFHSKYKSVHVHWHKTYGFGPPPYRLFELDQKSDVDDDNNSIPQEQVFYWDSQLEVEYVHQLQNLYFALTGEELIII